MRRLSIRVLQAPIMAFMVPSLLVCKRLMCSDRFNYPRVDQEADRCACRIRQQWFDISCRRRRTRPLQLSVAAARGAPTTAIHVREAPTALVLPRYRGIKSFAFRIVEAGQRQRGF